MHRTPCTKAQSLVEFALIAPLLMMILFGIVELGILLSIYVGMTNSTREAARAGSVYQYTGAPFSSADTAAAVTQMDAQRRQYLSDVITSTINPIVDPVEVSVTVSYTPTAALATNPYRAGDTIAVELDHIHMLFFGILGPKSITIRSVSAMRIEPGGKR